MNPPMKITTFGLEFLRMQESCRLRAYWDKSGWAIGYGHHGPDVNQFSTWSQNACDAALLSDTSKVSLSLSVLIHPPIIWYRFDAMVSVAYNIGISAFASSTLLERINSGTFNDVVNQLSRWVYSDHQIDNDLVARRKNEEALWDGTFKIGSQEASQIQQTTSEG